MMKHHRKANAIVGKLLVGNYLKLLPRIKKSLKERPQTSLGFESVRAQRALALAIHTELPPADIARYFELAQNLSAATFRFAEGKESFTRVVWDEEIMFNPGEKVGADDLIFPKWKHAFDLSLMRRKSDDLQLLTQLPESMMVSKMSSTPELDIAFYRFLGHFFSKEGDTGALLVRTSELMLKRSDNPVRDAFLNAVNWPELKLYEAFIRRDQSLLDKRMEEAIASHHKYYEHKTRNADELGWISLPMMAVSTLFKDNSDLEIPTNPYSYQPIVEGNI